MRSASEVIVRGSDAGVRAGRGDGARDRAFLGLCALLFVASAAGTIGWCGSMSDGMPMPGGWTMSMAWMRMPGQSWPGAAATFEAMWVLMMVAMMTPSLVPMLSGYRRSFGGNAPGGLTAFAGAGYFLVWALLGAALYPPGVLLAAGEMRWPALARAVPFAAGVALVLAGGIQLSAWKARQLRRCRSASACGPAPSRGVRGAVRHGLGLGVHCGLCCSGYMIALLVAGVMDPRAMVLVAAALTAERLGPWPEGIARGAGFGLLAAGLVVTARALGRM